MNKIYHDIKESTFFISIQNLDFYFSSQSLLERFNKEYDEYIKLEHDKILNRYKVEIDNLFFAMSLYKKIEWRGFKVLIDGEPIKDVKCILEYRK